MTKDLRNIALERIERLFKLANKAEDIKLAQKYARRARQISKRNRVSLPKKYKRRLCSNCNSFLVFGKNSRVRLKNGYVTIKCENCGDYTRYPY